MLEAGLYADNAFVTLTYKDDPVTLVPMDHRRFMDALRKRLKPLKVRFYMVGEYGDINERPHFHYVLFGYPSCRRASEKKRTYRCCSACDLIEEVWGKGLIKNLPLEMGSARYVARYVVKKMTAKDDPRLRGRHPEFSRKSLKPGVGHGVLDNVASIITRYNLLTPEGDVPVTLRHGNLQWPLGRYLRKKLRAKLGLDERSPHVQTPEAAHKYYHSEDNAAMRDVQQASIDDPENPGIRYHLLKASEGKRLQINRRLKMTKKGTL